MSNRGLHPHSAEKVRPEHRLYGHAFTATDETAPTYALISAGREISCRVGSFVVEAGLMRRAKPSSRAADGVLNMTQFTHEPRPRSR
jgi:hypothetical protein